MIKLHLYERPPSNLKPIQPFDKVTQGMALSDPPKARDYPKQWKYMSLELKLLFVYHGCMMVLFLIGEAFSTRQELAFATVLLFLLISLSIRHRRSTGWRWQGVKPLPCKFLTHAHFPLFPHPRSFPHSPHHSPHSLPSPPLSL